MKLEAQQGIFDDHDRRMIDLFRWMTNLQSHEKTLTSHIKPVEETISLKAYNHRLQLLTSRMRITDNAVGKIKVETVNSVYWNTYWNRSLN